MKLLTLKETGEIAFIYTRFSEISLTKYFVPYFLHIVLKIYSVNLCAMKYVCQEKKKIN